jgi:hypothetical protein
MPGVRPGLPSLGAHVPDLAHLHAAADHLFARHRDVLDYEVQSVDRAGRHVGQLTAMLIEHDDPGGVS